MNKASIEETCPLKTFCTSICMQLFLSSCMSHSKLSNSVKYSISSIKESNNYILMNDLTIDSPAVIRTSISPLLLDTITIRATYHKGQIRNKVKQLFNN